MGGPKHPLSYWCILLLFTWVDLQFISIYVLTRGFCVLLYARVRLIELAFKIHLRSWSFPWRSSLLFCFSIQCFSDVSCYSSVVSHLTLMYLIFFLVASWTTISFTSAALLLLCVYDLWFLFTVYPEICQIFIYNAVLWAIQFRHKCLPIHL